MRMALSWPDSRSPTLMSLPAFGAGSACCAADADMESMATHAANTSRLPNRVFVMSKCLRFLRLEQRPLPHRGRQRPFVEIVKLAADRHAMGQPGDLHIGLLQQVGDVMRGGLPVDRRIQRQDDFVH